MAPATRPTASSALPAEVIADRGWGVVDLLDGHEVAELLGAAEQIDLRDRPIVISSVDEPREASRAADQLVKRVVGSRLGELAPSLRPFLGAFIVKGHDGGRIDLHQDWTYHDERQEPALIVWAPLVDVDGSNGTLEVVDGSHRWSTAIRGSGSIPGIADDVQERLWDVAHAVPLRAGQALLYDPGLIHGSRPTGGSPRPVAALAAAPAGAPLVHFRGDDDGRIRGVAVDESWYSTKPFAEVPPDAEPVDPWAPGTVPLDDRRLQALLGSSS